MIWHRGLHTYFSSCLRLLVESDLKQRREIIAGGTSVFVDQQVVSAAVHGRVLILEGRACHCTGTDELAHQTVCAAGLEKAERNVLPILNNLLENREMQLEDGSFLTAPERFDALNGLLSKLREKRVERECVFVCEVSGDNLSVLAQTRTTKMGSNERSCTTCPS